MIKMTPKVTVLMPVYNGERFLSEAIDSILTQTFTDFEFLIIDDGSTDRSAALIESYSDPRIRLVRNSSNLGLIETLNKGFSLARGLYIARMDCDDVSFNDRLEKQISFMDGHPNVAVCGTWIKCIGRDEGYVFSYPTSPEEIKVTLLFKNVVAHPSVVVRRGFFHQFNLKYENYFCAEDYHLWLQVSKHGDIANLPEVLLSYRVFDQSFSESNREAQLRSLKKIHAEEIKRFGLEPSEEELNLHLSFALFSLPTEPSFITDIERWLLKLKQANDKKRLYPTKDFDHLLSTYWLRVCFSNYRDYKNWKLFYRSDLSKSSKLGAISKIKIGVSCLFFTLAKKFRKFLNIL